jgi:hypothetical protein
MYSPFSLLFVIAIDVLPRLFAMADGFETVKRSKHLL